jgi:oligoribonuclease NrnB/cAMP/cGMP phosphodiesterase (DHH superfamily)
MKLFHHTDLDGKACGAILTRRYPEAELKPYNYWYKPEIAFKDIQPGEAVIFGDITPRMENLDKLMAITNDITILDHHKSSLDDLNARNLSFSGKMTPDGLGACILVWEWCYPDKPVPSGIKFIANYDAWIRPPEAQRFVYGINSFNTLPTNHIWDKILNEDQFFLNNIDNIGRNVMSYIIPWYRRVVNSYGMSGFIRKNISETETQYSAMMVNQGAVDGAIFDDVKGDFDVYVRVVFGKDWKWLVSMTTPKDNIDLTNIARKFNGGGHTKAVGFAVEDLDDFFVFPDEN